MPTTIVQLQSCSPEELDDYLGRGWRPYGQQIYCSHFILLSRVQAAGVLPTRLELQNHRWRKGQAKLLRQNKARFTVVIRPAQPVDEAKISVNTAYMALYPDKSLEDLSIHLENEGQRIFDTWEVNVYDGDALVAFSYFDKGANSAYSKMGVYHPDYQSLSMGLFTMYLEMEWCMAQGLTWYYPGYVSPDTPLFDYKHRVGNLHFFHAPRSEWLPWQAFCPGEHSPLQLVNDRLESLKRELSEQGVAISSYCYYFFEFALFNGPTPLFPYLNAPRIEVLENKRPQHYTVLLYHFEEELYEYCHTSVRETLYFYDPVPTRYPIFPSSLFKTIPIMQSPDMDDIVHAVLEDYKRTRK